MDLGLWLASGVAGSVDAYRAMRLAHVHLNVLGWVGLSVVGTQFTPVADGAAHSRSWPTWPPWSPACGWSTWTGGSAA
jgi:hypothetical protein